MAVRKPFVNILGFFKEIATDLLGVGTGVSITATAGDISSPANGQIWYNSVTGKFRKMEGGVISDMDSGGSFDYGKDIATSTGQNLV